MESVSHAEGKRPCNESRQWQWVFRALWSSAPRAKDGQQQRQRQQQRADDADGLKSQSSRTATRTLPPQRREFRIPDTILFEQGEPRKWVGCSTEGIVVRKSFLSEVSGGGDVVNGPTKSSTSAHFNNTAASSEIRHQPIPINRRTTGDDNPKERTSSLPSSTSSSTGGVIDNPEVADRLNAIRAAFLSFAGSSHPPAPGAPVCVARYNDGSMELLSDKSLDTLLRYRDWRSSLSGLQAYIHALKTVTGTYVRCDEGQEDTHRQSQGNTSKSENIVLAGSRPVGSSVASSECKRSRIHSPPPTMSSSEITSTRSRGSTEEESAGSMSAGKKKSPVLDLDRVTQDVAFLAEMSYALREPGSNRIGYTTSTGHDGGFVRCQNNLPRGKEKGESEMVLVGEPTRSRRFPWPKSRISITRLEAEFTVDQSGCAWLTNAKQVLVHHPARGQPKHSSSIGSEDQSRSKQKRRKGEAALAASVAARELRGLMCLARRRGLNADEAFRHFEVEGTRGRAGKREVLKGMASLGLTLSEEAATFLVEIIVSSTEAPRSKMSETELESLKKTADMRSEREGAAVSGVSALRRWRVIPKRARTPPKSLPPLREYFTSGDLWHFAGIPDGVTAIISGHANDLGNEETGVTHHNGVPKCARSHRTRALVDDKGHAQSKRRRTNQEGGEWIGGEASAGRNTVDNATTSKKPPSRRRTPPHKTLESSSFWQNGSGRDHRGPVPMREERASHVPSTLSATSVSNGGSSSARQKTSLGAAARNATQPRLCSMPNPSGSTNCKRGWSQRGAADRRQTFHSWADSSTEDPARKPMWASFPCEDPVAEATNGKDRVFHVDRYGESERVHLRVTIRYSR